MKNIHILPTPNESRLYYNSQEKEYQLCEFPKYHTDIKSTHNISITSDEKPKVGDWTLMFDDYGNLFLCDKPQQYLGIEKGHHLNKGLRKIILTTDQDLIKDGVQTIDDEFLEWFVKNPSCEEVEIGNQSIKSFDTGHFEDFYKIIIPKEEPKKETFEEAAERWNEKQTTLEFGKPHNAPNRIKAFIEGAKSQEEKTIEEVFEWLTSKNYLTDLKETLIKDFKQFKNK